MKKIIMLLVVLWFLFSFMAYGGWFAWQWEFRGKGPHVFRHFDKGSYLHRKVMLKGILLSVFGPISFGVIAYRTGLFYYGFKWQFDDG